jgi:hypothetical protein
VVEEETCDGWHPLHRDVFMDAIGKNEPPKPKAS